MPHATRPTHANPVSRRARALTETFAAATFALATAFAPQTAPGTDLPDSTDNAAPPQFVQPKLTPTPARSQSNPSHTWRSSAYENAAPHATGPAFRRTSPSGRLHPRSEAEQTKTDAPKRFAAALQSFKYKEKYGYLDADGTVAVLPRYDAALPFSENLAAVKLEERWYYINANGEVVIPVLGKSAKELFLDGYVNIKDTPLSPYTEAGSFHEGRAWVGQFGRHGMIDKNGRKITPLKYESAGAFSNGLATVGKDGKYGYVNTKGEEVIPPKYSFAGQFQDGVAIVKKHADFAPCGLIDKTGKEVIPVAYRELRRLSNDIFAVSESLSTGEQGHYAILDKTGKQLTPFKYLEIRDFQDGIAAVKTGSGRHFPIPSPNMEGRSRGWAIELEKWGFVDATGKEVIVPKYREVWGFHDDACVVTVISEDGSLRFSVIDKTGTEIVEAGKYSCPSTRFSEGLLAVLNKKGEFGYIDTSGEEVIACQYKDARPFENGKATVKTKDGYSRLIDKTGKEIP